MSKFYSLINSGRSVKLSSLILSGDLSDSFIISVYDRYGNFVCKGHWYSDDILFWKSFYGYAIKSGSGLSVTFKFV